MKNVLFVILIFMIYGAYASCSENQIDINSASITDLDKLTGIGEVKAQSIIDSRPFDEVDDLLDVYGIGDATLQKIKEQDLACVDSEDKNDYEEKFIPEEKVAFNEPLEFEEEIPQVIELSSGKDIKSENDSKILNKTDYAKYGFIVFCVLIGFLFMFRNRKDRGLV